MNKMKIQAAVPEHLQVLLMAVISMLAFLVLLLPQAYARAESPLVVGVTEAPPFVVKTSDGRWSGPVFELWEHIAKELEQSYTLREMDLESMLSALEQEEIEVAVAALSVTADRESRFDFTHPFHASGTGIASRSLGTTGPLEVAYRLISRPFLNAAGGLLLLLLVTGMVMTILERRTNPEQFGGTWWKGLGSGFWWSAVTMTTVGYGDKSPRTAAGRAVAVIWMFVAIITISGFTAGIASTLTVERLTAVTEPDDLKHVRVGTVASSNSAEYLQRERIAFEEFRTLRDALQQLAEGELDAVVYDIPLIAYQLERHPEWSHISVLPGTVISTQNAFGLPEGSELREPINRIIPAYTGTRDWRVRMEDY